MGTSGQRREEKRQLGGDFDSMMEVVTVLIQRWYNDNPGVECGKGGESVVSILCLYSLAGAKWEIIAAGGTLHRLESIYTANTDRKGCGQLRVLFDLIKTQIILLYRLFQGEVRNIMWKEAEAKLQQSNRRETFETIQCLHFKNAASCAGSAIAAL